MPTPDVLRIGNASGFYGDRADAVVEMLTDGPLDVLTGDYLAELTMLILWRTRLKNPDHGYARSFLRQMRDGLRIAHDRGVKIVVNAGGLNPAGLAAALRELAADQGVDVGIAHVEGDDLLGRLAELQAAGHDLANLDTGAPLSSLANEPLTANAYLGGFGIAAALSAGADIVVTGRVTDAAVVVGPAVAHFGWARDDVHQLAGAVVAGHVIECGTQATGGNFPFFTELLDRGVDLTHPGFPIAELHRDGSSVITKHPGTGGAVTVDTVTAQLLYEIQGHRYANPDVITRLDSIALAADGLDRVRVSGVRGEPAPDDVKVAINTLGGFRNRVTYVLTGLDIARKAALVEQQLRAALDVDALTASGGALTFTLHRTDTPDADTNVAATALLQVDVSHPDGNVIGRAFSGACVEIALASYPGCTMTAPPGNADPYGVYWPTLVPKSVLSEVAVLADGSRVDVPQHPAGGALGVVNLPSSAADLGGPTKRVPLGTLVGARSGDKGGNANIGVWVRDDAAWPWLASFLTTERLQELLPEAAPLVVDRYELPNLRAVNFVIHGLLGAGVASSNRPDPQAKGLGEWLRSRVVDVPVALLG